MSLSRSWTRKRFWDQAVKNAGLVGQVKDYERADLIRPVVESVSDAIYGLVSNAYMTRTTVVPSGDDIIDLSAIPLKRGYEHKIILESLTGGSSSTGELAGVKTDVVAGSNSVVFDTPLASVNYIVFARIYDAGGASIGFNQLITKATTGFTVLDVVEAGTMEYFVHELTGAEAANSQAVLAGNNAIAFPSALSGSGYVLLWRVFDASGASIGSTISNRTATGFEIDCLEAGTIEYYAILTSSTFPFGIIKNAVTAAVPAGSSTAIVLSTAMSASNYGILLPWFYDAGQATLPWTISSKTVSGFTVTNGDVVPGTFEAITLDVGQQSGGSSGTSISRVFEGLSEEALRMFALHSDSRFNYKRMVFSYNGEELALGRGDFFSAWGTITLRYPRIPTEAATDAAYIDLPDGMGIELGLIALETRLRRRHGAQMNGQVDKAREILKTGHESAGRAISTEELKRKVEGIL